MLKLYPVFATVFALMFFSAVAVADDLDQPILDLQHQWARANYQIADSEKEATFKALMEKAAALTAAHPDRAEPKIWEAIIRAGYAGSLGGVSSMFSAMPQMKQGRDLLLQAEKINPTAMNGAIYTTLGSFYYMVPGGFIGFGDRDKALKYLNRALEIAPDDVDANYFTGDFWMEKKKYSKAIPYLEKVLSLPDVESRPVYSKGRKAEAEEKLARARKKSR